MLQSQNGIKNDIISSRLLHCHNISHVVCEIGVVGGQQLYGLCIQITLMFCVKCLGRIVSLPNSLVYDKIPAQLVPFSQQNPQS